MRAARNSVNLDGLGRLQCSHSDTRHESLVSAGNTASQRDADSRGTMGHVIHKPAFEKQVGGRAMDECGAGFSHLPTSMLIKKNPVAKQGAGCQQTHLGENIHIIKLLRV